jgi:hypothetical protein
MFRDYYPLKLIYLILKVLTMKISMLKFEIIYMYFIYIMHYLFLGNISAIV